MQEKIGMDCLPLLDYEDLQKLGVPRKHADTVMRGLSSISKQPELFLDQQACIRHSQQSTQGEPHIGNWKWLLTQEQKKGVQRGCKYISLAMDN